MKSSQNLFLTGFVIFILILCSKGQVYGQERNTVSDEHIANVFMDAMQDVMLDKIEEAFEKFTFVVEQEPEHATAHFQLSKIWMKKGKIHEAIKEIEQALLYDSDNKWMLDHAGKLFVFDKQYEKAVKVYEQLAAEESAPEEYLVKLAFVLNQAGKYEEALLVFDQLMLYSSEDDVDLLVQKQKMYLKLNQYQKAIDISEQLIEFYPHEFEYYILLAAVYSEINEPQQIISTFERADRRFPLEAKLHSLVIREYLKNEDLEKAKTYIREILLERAGNEDDKMKILMSLMKSFKTDSFAREVLTEIGPAIVDKYPESAEFSLIYGYILKEADSTDAALNQFKKTIHLDSSINFAWEEIILMHARQNDYDSVIYYAQEANQLFPKLTLPLFYEANAYIQQKHYEKAIPLLEKAISNTPGTDTGLLVSMHGLLGDIFQETGNFEMAEMHYIDALKLNPNEMNILNNYSYSLALTGEKLDFAEQMSERTILEFPEKAIYLDTYGWILYQQGAFKKARKYIKRAIKYAKGIESAVMFEHLGDIEYKLGNKNLALKNWNTAFESGADSESLKNKIKTQKLND